MRKKLFLASLCVALGLPVLGGSPATAAAPLDVTCPFSLTVTVDPGSTLTTQAQQVTGEIRAGTALSPATPCSSLTGTPYRGVTGTVTGSGRLSCLLDGSLSGTIDLKADNGDTATLAWTVRGVLFIPVFSVTVTGGVLTGATFLALPLPVGFSGSCLLGPIRSLTFLGVAHAIRL